MRELFHEQSPKAFDRALKLQEFHNEAISHDLNRSGRHVRLLCEQSQNAGGYCVLLNRSMIIFRSL